jgi:hypothetical protein
MLLVLLADEVVGEVLNDETDSYGSEALFALACFSYKH